MRSILLLFIASLCYGLEGDRYTKLIDDSIKLLSERKYDQYLAYFDPESIAVEAIKNNLKSLEKMDKNIVTMDNKVEIQSKFGEDNEYVAYRVLHTTNLVLKFDDGNKGISQTYEAIFVIRKDIMKITGYLPARNVSTTKTDSSLP